MSADLLCRLRDVSSDAHISFTATVWKTLYNIVGYLCSLLASLPILTTR